MEDPGYCDWAVRQIKPGAVKLNQFKYFLRRMEDLTQRTQGICGKASEVERQLRDRILDVCCEERMAKLGRQEERAMEEERTRQCRSREEIREKKVGGETREETRVKSSWVDMDEDSKDQLGVERQALSEAAGNLEGGVAEYQEEIGVAVTHEGDRCERLVAKQRQGKQGEGQEAADDGEMGAKLRQGKSGEGQEAVHDWGSWRSPDEIGATTQKRWTETKVRGDRMRKRSEDKKQQGRWDPNFCPACEHPNIFDCGCVDVEFGKELGREKRQRQDQEQVPWESLGQKDEARSSGEGEPRSDGNLEHKIGIRTNGGEKVGTGGLGMKERGGW